MKKLILIPALALILFSCFKKEEDPQLASEKEFQTYIKNNNLTTPRESGLYFIPSDIGTGAQPVKGDYVMINYTGSLLKGTVIETNDSVLASKNFMYSATKTNIPLKVDFSSSLFPGVSEGISLMKEGGKAKMVLPYQLANGIYSTRTLPFYANLVYDVELVKVIKNPIQSDSLLLIKTLDSLSIAHATNFDTVYYKEITAGTDSILNTDSIFYSYTTTIVDGYVVEKVALDTVFLANIDKEAVGIGAGLRKMKSGGKAKLVIWQKYGYAEKGLMGNRQDFYLQQIIPPHTSFIMDVEIKGVGHKK